jgi:hypothetical protein
MKIESQGVKDKLLNVENRLKSKFQHITKLEASLDKLLSQNPLLSNDDESVSS